MPFSFTITKQDTESRARLGVLDLGFSPIETPVFMPVGPRGTVKVMTQAGLEEIGYRLILGNTYHLAMRPGPDFIEKAGGLHNFIAWPHGILTDSGGYQVFSLPLLRKIRDEGVDFRSIVNGDRIHFDGSPQTRWARNLIAHPAIAVHPPDAENVVIIEGVARQLADDELSAAAWAELDGLYAAKYGMEGSPYWVVEPRLVLAWAGVNLGTMTRWRFG